MKQTLRDVFQTVLAQLELRRCLQAQQDRLRRFADRPLLVIAFGKAALPMAQTVHEMLADRVPMRGLVVPPAGEQDAGIAAAAFETIAGGHPLPDRQSLAAGRRALDLLATTHANERVLFLVSGGGSALLEWPRVVGVTIDELRSFYQALVASGADIQSINAVRRAFSAIKGGRLAAAGRRANRQLTLAVSDVPNDAPQAIASGPTVACADPPGFADDVLRRFALHDQIPSAFAGSLSANHESVPPSVPPDSEFVVVLGEGHARNAAVAALEQDHGCVVEAGDRVDVDDWSVEAAATHLLKRLAELRQQHPGRRVAIVTTGELSVPLPTNPGVGGRNQQFALQLALQLDAGSEEACKVDGRAVTALSCGTDGVDGVAPAAGAVVDGTTVARAQSAGHDPKARLLACDAHPLFAALGDAVVTGPTGTNVRDLRILVHEA
ncbi:MAG: glycerate kinase [Planctomycetota bacterium]